MTKIKYGVKDIFRGGRLVKKFLIDELQDLQDQIDTLSAFDGELEIPDPVTIKEDVELSAQALGSNFGAANKFTGVGVVKNSSGVYIVVSDGSAFKYVALDDLT